jgi:signal transduction histidine kinase
MVLVKREDGKVLGVAAVIRDISARWQREKERIRVLENKA